MPERRLMDDERALSQAMTETEHAAANLSSVLSREQIAERVLLVDLLDALARERGAFHSVILTLGNRRKGQT